MQHLSINYYLYAGMSYPKGYNEFIKLPIEVKNQYVKSIEKFLSLCNHEWKYRGHTHGGEYYECKHCGIEGRD